MTTDLAFDLLARGWFPKELPPSFTTLDFANKVLGYAGTWPKFVSNEKRTQLCTHSYAKAALYRRPLGIPNPVPQLALSLLIAKHWARIERLIRRSGLGISYPVAGQTRALMPGEKDVAKERARSRATARFVVLGDISRFYHSIYTHAIAWAVHGKGEAKQKYGRRWEHLLGNKIDRLLMESQDGQTQGIPVGPDTSLVCAELIAAAVDVLLQKMRRRIAGVRFMDDYELPLASRGEAESALDALQVALAEYGLALNPLKTRIVELPHGFDQSWKVPIRAMQFRWPPAEQATDLVAFFDVAFGVAQDHREKSAVGYALDRLDNQFIHPNNWELYQSLLLQAVTVEPGTAPTAFHRLAAAKWRGQSLNVKQIADFAADQINEHARLGHANEVAWALWAALVFDVKLGRIESKALAAMSDSVVALSALHAMRRGLFKSKVDTNNWRELLTSEQLLGDQWLLAYEAAVKSWLRPSGGANYIQADSTFEFFFNLGVEFYDESKASPIPPSPSPSPSWIAEMRTASRERAKHYGSDEGEPDSHDSEALTF
ncbi:MAG: RNA-directed DNA polymerase [Gemmatimonadaceae bacterium]